MIEIVFVRHAQPMWEPGGRAVDDPDLTELGREQAERLARHLKGERFDAFYCSTLRRACQTAEPIARGLDAQPEFHPWLEELRLPSLEGQPAEAVHRFLGQARARDLEHWWDGTPGGESFRHFHERVTGGFEPLLTSEHRACVHGQGAFRLWQVPPEPRRILTVAHCGTIAVLLSFLLGIEPVPWEWERFRVGWAGLARVRTVDLAGGAVWSLTSFNPRSHLAGLPDPEG
ncbi:MAG: histidine phosphatase family protein [Candidatus Eremiobacterota bacterium]